MISSELHTWGKSYPVVVNVRAVRHAVDYERRTIAEVDSEQNRVIGRRATRQE